MKKKIKNALCFFLQGFCMGIAHIIPGVSGGTIAFLLGIYEDLIKAIKSIDLHFFRLLLSFQFSKALNQISWKLLSMVFSGMIVAIFTLSKFMGWLLLNKPVLINAFFFGLILATGPIILRSLKQKWNINMILLGFVSIVVMYYLVGMVPINTPDNRWFLFFCGAIAICTMILPGISGSFVLLILGKYQYIVEAINQREWISLIVIALGCTVGILLFVRFLNWIFNRFHDQTLIILTGLVLGSLRKIWPWKETLKSITTSKGKVIPIEQINVIPSQANAELIWAISLCLAGFVLAFLLSHNSKQESINL